MSRRLHAGNAHNKDITAMTMPLFVMAFFYYGPRVVALALVAVVTARAADWLAARLRSRRFDPTENSSTPMALIIVLMMPASVRFRVVIVAVLVAIFVAKEAFGGAGSYPFNPAAVGFCVAAVSWPDEVFSYPAPTNWIMGWQSTLEELLPVWRFEGVALGRSPSYILKNGGLPSMSEWNLLLGNFAAPLGMTAALVIVSCAVYLMLRKRISLAATLSFLGMAALIAYLFPRGGGVSWTTLPWQNVMARLQVVQYELLAGAMVFAAVFLVNEPVTLPKNTASRILYGALLGFATMMFRYYGTYELGACFAFLLVNATSGYFDRALAKLRASRKKVIPG